MQRLESADLRFRDEVDLGSLPNGADSPGDVPAGVAVAVADVHHLFLAARGVVGRAWTLLDFTNYRGKDFISGD